MANNPISGIQNFIGDVGQAVDSLRSYAGAFSSRQTSVPRDGLNQFKTTTAATVATAANDWRVRIEVPTPYRSSPVLAPLMETNNSMVFPFTPTIMLNHTADYSQLDPVHTNYPFPIYEKSYVNDIMISGDFFVETPDDAAYWVATVHFLRSITKMYYGQTSNAGAPPPLCRLYGYGEYVFNSVPVVVSNFTMDMPADVDYIKTTVPGASAESWVPVKSVAQVTLKPTYSRDTVRQFSMDNFINGGYILDDKGFI